MTHVYQTSALKSNKFMTHFYQVEVIDFDMESTYYDVTARNCNDASDKARDLAYQDGLDIYMMNINKY